MSPQTFQPRVATRFAYYHGERAMPIETFPIFALLPLGVEKLIGLMPDSSMDADRRKEVVGVVSALLDRGLASEVFLSSEDLGNLALARQLAPEIHTAAFGNVDPGAYRPAAAGVLP